MNNTMSDIATALTQSIAVDGQSPITANIPLNNHKLTGVAAASTSGDALVFGQSNVSLPGLTLTGALAMSGAPINGWYGSDVASAATIDLDAVTGNCINITGTTGITAVTLTAGRTRIGRFTGILQLTNSAGLVLQGGANITTAVNDMALFVSGPSNIVYVTYFRASGRPLVFAGVSAAVRQTVLYGPQAAGVSDLIPQTQVGNTLASGVTLKFSTTTGGVTCANGFNTDGSQNDTIWVTSVDLAIPNLTGSVTNYIWVDPVAQTGGFVTVADAAQSGGTIPITNNQHTFDYSPGGFKNYLGNGATAVQSNHVIVAEVDTSGTVVTAIRCRAYQGRFNGPATAIPLSGNRTSLSSNIGPDGGAQTVSVIAKFTTGVAGYSVGDRVPFAQGDQGGGIVDGCMVVIEGRNTVTYIAPFNDRFYLPNKTTSVGTQVPTSNCNFVINHYRGF